MNHLPPIGESNSQNLRDLHDINGRITPVHVGLPDDTEPHLGRKRLPSLTTPYPATAPSNSSPKIEQLRQKSGSDSNLLTRSGTLRPVRPSQIGQKLIIENSFPIAEAAVDSEGHRLIGNIVLFKTVGQGMYGKVKIGKDLNTGETRAIKVLRKQRLKRMRKIKPGKVSDAYQDLLVEIAILKKLRHPNVVYLYDVIDDEKNDKLYLVLDFIEKGQVMKLDHDNVPVEPLPIDTTWNYFRDLIHGLNYLHVQNIIHRDIKPENLLVSVNGTLKICDFGVAQVLDNSDEMITNTKGSPAFCAPEVLNTRSYLGPPIDIWAAGVSLYCFLFGKVPFHSTTVKELAEKIQNEPLVIPADTEPGLRDLLSRMLEKDPQQRITISQIKVHPWVTRSGSSPMKADPLEVWVTDEEIAHAIRSTESIANVVFAAKRLIRGFHQRKHITTEVARNVQKSEEPKSLPRIMKSKFGAYWRISTFGLNELRTIPNKAETEAYVH